MSKKLTKKELEKKRKYHQSRVSYYDSKINDIELKQHRIGFKHYD